MSEVRDTFLRATMTLAKGSGANWFEFVEAFKLLTAYELERGLRTPPSEAQVALGMNRRMVELRDIFVEITK